jgi:hypothetical protein
MGWLGAMKDGSYYSSLDWVYALHQHMLLWVTGVLTLSRRSSASRVATALHIGRVLPIPTAYTAQLTHALLRLQQLQ